MQTRFLGRVCAALVSLFLALSCASPVAFADDAQSRSLSDDAVSWAGWVSESLGNLFVDFVALRTEGYSPLSPADLAAFTIAYPTSQAMASAVRELPEYQALYGYNPLDASAVIRSYDGGSQVSVLTDVGLYNAWLWLHGGVPPVDSSGGGSSALPSGSRVYIEFTDSIGDSLSFSDGSVLSLDSSSSYRSNYNRMAGYGQATFLFCASGSDPSTVIPLSSPSAIYHWVSGVGAREPVGDVGVSIRFTPLATSLGLSDPGFESSFAITPLSSVAYSSSSPSNENNFGYGDLTALVSNTFDGPVGFYKASQGNGYVRYYLPNSGSVYIVTNSSVWAYGSWSDGQSGPSPAPEPVEPVGPSSPDIDSPESDGPVQTNVDVTVVLPSGDTVYIAAPAADIQPIVTWLSIINSNIVAWGGNISQWAQEIYSVLDAFRQAVDNWSVSILAAINDLGNVVPVFGPGETNYWNNVNEYTTSVFSYAPTSNDQTTIKGGFERLKTKFPFSVPWDLLAILLLFDADPVAPEFEVPLVYMGSAGTETETLEIDLSAFDYPMSTFRRLWFIMFAGFLALKTKDLLAYVLSFNDVI